MEAKTTLESVADKITLLSVAAKHDLYGFKPKILSVTNNATLEKVLPKL